MWEVFAMPISEAKKRANKKFNQKAYEYFRLRMRKGNRSVIADHIAISGESTNAFILRAINTQIRLDYESNPSLTDKEAPTVK